MLRSSDRDVLKELSREQLISHKMRNVFMIIAIALTTILISSVLTTGFSFLTTMQESVQAAPGPGSDGALVGTKEQYEEVTKKEQVQWADFVQLCSTTSLHNSIFAGIQTKLLAPNSSFYEHNMVSLIEGKFPEKADEILLSDTLAEKIGLKEIGEQIELKVVTLKDGQETEIGIPVKICGFYKNPLANLSSTYEEIYTTSAFVSEYNSEMPFNQNYIYIKLNNLNPFLLKSDVYKKLVELQESVKAESVLTRHYSDFTYSLIMLIPVFFIIILIMISGYFLIFNVFSISVVTDIRWFGMMKTIGATKKQLNYIYKRQVKQLALIGSAIGSLVGYFVGIFLAPGIMRMTSYYNYYKNPNILYVLTFAILFSWLTVWISSSKSIRKASTLSPIEAARYLPNKRKRLFTVISFALSGIAFLVICNITFGYRVNYMVERYNQEECQIYHMAKNGWLEESYIPISQELCEKIEQLPFVERVDIIYRAKTFPDLVMDMSQRWYEGFTAEVKLNGLLKEEIDAMVQTGQISVDAGTLNMTESGNIKLEICGIPADRIEQEIEYVKVLEGIVDKEKFATGEYVIYQSIDNLGLTKGLIADDKGVHAGDKLDLSFYDDKLGTYQNKTMTVMAVVHNNNPYGTGDIAGSNFILSDQTFKEIYSEYNERISDIQVITKEHLGEAEIEKITNLTKEKNNVQIKIDSKYDSELYYVNQKKSITIIGIFLVSMLGMIGISNMINTIITDVLSKKNEIATLQSIGMTKKQLWLLLFRESFILCLISIVVMITAGGYATTAVAASSSFTGFDKPLFIVSIGILLVVISTLSAVLASAMTKMLNKKSVVERLREVE